MQITSFQTSLPLKFQINSAVGFVVCYIVMLAIYYGNAWGSKSLPFMSSRLLTTNGTSYPVSKVFNQGVLDEDALVTYGIPRLTGTFAYGMFMANAAVGSSFSLLVGSRLTMLIDRRHGCTLHPLLGQRCHQSVQEHKVRKFRRSTPSAHGKALQRNTSMVVRRCHSCQLHSRSGCCSQGKCNPTSLGVHYLAVAGNCLRSICK